MAVDASTAQGDAVASVCLCAFCEIYVVPAQSTLRTECQMLHVEDRRLWLARGCFLAELTGLPLSAAHIVDSFLNRHL